MCNVVGNSVIDCDGRDLWCDPGLKPRTAAFAKRAYFVPHIEAVAQYDIAGATVERICGRAGASRGLIAHFYASKEDLLVAALTSKFDEALSVKEAIAKDPAFKPLRKIELIAQSQASSRRHLTGKRWLRGKRSQTLVDRFQFTTNRFDV